MIDPMGSSRRFTREHVAWILRSPNAATVVEVDGGVRGAVMVAVERGMARVLSVAVDPGHRRQGIGSQLMAAAESLSRERGAGTVTLEVGVSNLGAVAFYRGLGYRVGARLFAYYSWGEDAFGMTKDLRAAPASAGRPR